MSFLCAEYNKSFCSNPVFYSFCPSICGYNVESTNVSVDCDVKTTEYSEMRSTDDDKITNFPATHCPMLDCKNGGSVDFKLCSCICHLPWSGSCNLNF